MTYSATLDLAQLKTLYPGRSYTLAITKPKVWHKHKYAYTAQCGATVEPLSYVNAKKKLRLCSSCFTKKEKEVVEQTYGKFVEEFRTPDLMISRKTKTVIAVRVDGVKAGDTASVVVNDGSVVVTVEGN